MHRINCKEWRPLCFLQPKSRLLPQMHLLTKPQKGQKLIPYVFIRYRAHHAPMSIDGPGEMSTCASRTISGRMILFSHPRPFLPGPGNPAVVHRPHNILKGMRPFSAWPERGHGRVDLP